MIKLPSQSLALLKKCLQKYEPELILKIENPYISEFTIEFYNQLREIVGNELINNGLRDDDEPNKYGLKLENLIDEIGKLFLYK